MFPCRDVKGYIVLQIRRAFDDSKLPKSIYRYIPKINRPAKHDSLQQLSHFIAGSSQIPGKATVVDSYHYIEHTWALRCLKPPATWLFVK